MRIKQIIIYYILRTITRLDIDIDISIVIILINILFNLLIYQIEIMSHTQLILEIKKISNWNQQNRFIKIKILWAVDGKLLIEKFIQGKKENKSLIINLLLKIQMSYLREKIRLCLYSLQEICIGEVELHLDQIIAKKQKIQQYAIPKSQNKILQIQKHPPTNTNPKASKIQKSPEVLFKEYPSKKSLKNIESKHTNLHRENQKMVNQYKSNPKSNNLPEKIHNIIQDVRKIKQGLRISRTKSNQKLAESRERIKSIGRMSNSNLKTEQIKNIVEVNNKIESSPNVQLSKKLQEYGLNQYLGSQKDIKNIKIESKVVGSRQRIMSKNHK